MAKTIIYMNDQLHAKKPKHGVITVKQGRKKWMTNKVVLNASANLYGSGEIAKEEDSVVVPAWSAEVKFDPRGCSAVRTHKVVAWIEVD